MYAKWKLTLQIYSLIFCKIELLAGACWNSKPTPSIVTKWPPTAHGAKIIPICFSLYKILPTENRPKTKHNPGMKSGRETSSAPTETVVGRGPDTPLVKGNFTWKGPLQRRPSCLSTRDGTLTVA